jgi:hypothetical protein
MTIGEARERVVSTLIMLAMGIALLGLCITRAYWFYAIALAFCLGCHVMLLFKRMDVYLDARKADMEREREP